MFTYKTVRQSVTKVIVFILIFAMVVPLFPQRVAAAVGAGFTVPYVITRDGVHSTPTNPLFTDYRISLSGHAGAQNYSISVMTVENGSTAASVAAELNRGLTTEMQEFAVRGNPPYDAQDRPNIHEFDFEMEVWEVEDFGFVLDIVPEVSYVAIDETDEDDPIEDHFDDEDIEALDEVEVIEAVEEVEDIEAIEETEDIEETEKPEVIEELEIVEEFEEIEPFEDIEAVEGIEAFEEVEIIEGIDDDADDFEADEDDGDIDDFDEGEEAFEDTDDFDEAEDEDDEEAALVDTDDTADEPEVEFIPEIFIDPLSEIGFAPHILGGSRGVPILRIHGEEPGTYAGMYTGGPIVLGEGNPPMPGGFESLVEPVGTVTFTWPRAQVVGSGGIGLLSPGEEYLNENGTIREEFWNSPIIVTVAIVITPLGFDMERTAGSVTYRVNDFAPVLEEDVIIVVFDYSKPPASTGDPLLDEMMWEWFQNMLFNMRFVGDPIDAFSGNFYWEYTDLTIYSDPPMHFTRFYNSQDAHVGMLGRGWRHSFEIEVVEDELGVKLVLPSGSEVDFFFDAAYLTPRPPRGWDIEVVTNSSNDILGYDVTGPNGIGYTIRDGLVTEIFERGRRMYTISHSGSSQRVTRVDTGAWFDISPSGVTDSAGRTVVFEITGDFLTRTINPDGDSLVYTYTSEGFIESIIDFMGVNLLTNEYMAHGRVVRQSVPGIPDTFYDYRYDATKTFFTDKNGVEWIYSFAGHSSPTRIADDNGETVMTYNENGLLTSITDRMGLVTTFEYDGLKLIAINYPDGTSVHLTYNEDGILTSETDRSGFTTFFNDSGTVRAVRDGNGNMTTFNRDARNHLTSIVDREGNVTTITTNNLGNPLTIMTPDGQTTTNTFDAVGRLTSSTTPMGRTTTLIHSAAGKLQAIIDADGVKTEYAHNANGFTTVLTNRVGDTMVITYNESGQITSITDLNGNVTTQTFNEFGNLAEIRTPMGGVTRFDYDQYDNLTSVINPLGGRMLMEYDLENRPTSHTDPFGNRETFTYNAQGQVSVITARNSGQTTFTYDNFGRILTQTDALGGVTRFTYDGNGNVLTMTDPRGNVTRYAYDREDRLIRITNALNEVTQFIYDDYGHGRVVRIIDAMSGEATFGYNHDGMPTRRTDEEARVTTFAYDADMGRMISRTDPDGAVTRFAYDLNGHIISVHNPGQTLPYYFEYDANGNLTQVTDPMGNVTTFTYDRENRLTSETDPMGHVTTFAHDYAGNVIEIVDALSGTITMTYDSLSRMTSMTNQNGVRTDFTYDAMGNIVSIRTGNLAEMRYEYDLLGNLTRAAVMEGGTAFATLFAYDANGNLTRATDPNGNVTAYTYDALNRISTITNAVGGVFTITYDALGRVSQIVDEEGAVTRYFYDRTGLLIRIEDALGHSRTFTYDALGRMTSETDENGATRRFEYDLQGNLTRFESGEGLSWLYTYDELGRMIEVRGPAPSRHLTRYEHDDLGRVIRRIDAQNHERRFTYDALNRITSVTDELGNVTRYRYDAVGNVIEVIDPSGHSIHYEYDGLNRLTRINAEWESTFQSTIYQFNGRGLLVTEINALGARKTHEYDPAGNAIITIDEDGNVINREFNALNLVSAVTADDILLGFVYDRTGRLVSMTDTTGETSFLLDPLYRIREVTDSFGRVTAYDYDPAGNLISITYPDASVVTYTHNRDNQILTIRDRDGGITRNEYDSYGRLARQHLPNGGHTEFSYNSLNQMTQQREIFNARTTRQFSYGYTDNGFLQTETIQFFGVDNEDTSRMLRYDANGRLYLTIDTLMGRIEYDYDSMGNLIRENRAGNITTFTYNAMNQLVSRTTPTGQYTYTYDRRGNLLSESRGGVPVRTFEFDALGRMIRGTNELGETSAYEYNALNLRVANVQHLLPGHEGGHGWDVNGYLTDEPNSPGSRYIDVNRQALAGLPAGVWLDALDGYDWDIEALRDIETLRNAEGGVPYMHQRIFKDNFGLNRNSGVVRQEFVIDYVMGFNQDLMMVEAGGWETVFVYGTPLQRISQHTTKTSDIISGVPAVGGAIDPHGNVAADIAVVPTYQVLYYRLDFRNSTSQMQLPNGQYIAWTGYDEWGVVTSPSSHDMNMAGVQDSIRFTSYTKDRVLGLYYAQNRWYDATTRRFTAVDPIKDGDNWYIYVGNNPVNFIDPTGLMPDPGFGFGTPRPVHGPQQANDDEDEPLRVSVNPTIVTTPPTPADPREAPHVPYTRFDTKNNAILAWALTYHPLSTPTEVFPNGSEWGTWIYKDPITGLYMFGDEPAPGNRGEDFVIFPIGEEGIDSRVVGAIHTHPVPFPEWLLGATVFETLAQGYPGLPIGMEHFSIFDINFVRSLGVPLYLVTPYGVVLRLDPSIAESGLDFDEGEIVVLVVSPDVSMIFWNIHIECQMIGGGLN